MIEWIVSSSLLILLVALLRRLLGNRISLRLRYALWLLVLLRLLVPGTVGQSPVSVQGPVEDIQSQIADVNLTGNWAVITMAPVPVGGAAGNDGSGGGDSVTTIPDTPDSGASDQATVGLLLPAVGAVLRCLWWMGMGLTALLLVAANLSFYRNLRRSRRKLETEISTIVYVTEGIQSPCLFGLVHPAIYVPASVAADETALRHVLAHEAVHRRHGDHIWTALRGLCLVLHWYNPLVWWAAALSRRDCELACDEAAVKALGEESRAAYGRTLVGLAEQHSNLMRCATSMSGSDLKERIAALVKHPRTKKTAAVVLVLAVVIVGLVVFTGRADTYQARVVSQGENSVWLAPTTDAGLRKATCEVVSYSGDLSEELAVGDLVEVTRGNGNMELSYPPQGNVERVKLVSRATDQDWFLCDAFARLVMMADWHVGDGSIADGQVEEDADEVRVIFDLEKGQEMFGYTPGRELLWSGTGESDGAVASSGIEALPSEFRLLAEDQGATIQMRTAPDGPDYAAYTVDAQWLQDNILDEFDNYDTSEDTYTIQMEDQDPTEGLYLQLSTPGFTIQIGEDNVVRFTYGSETVVWKARYLYGEDVFYDSILTVCRDGYDQMTMGDLTEQTVSAPANEDATALKTLWQNWLAQMFHNQAPGSHYELEGYQVGTVEITERAAGEDGSVRATFDAEILVKPTDYEGTFWWMGNGGGAEEEYGQEYAGWILETYQGWLLREGESGLWQIVDFGTGGYTLENLLKQYPLEAVPSGFGVPEGAEILESGEDYVTYRYQDRVYTGRREQLETDPATVFEWLGLGEVSDTVVEMPLGDGNGYSLYTGEKGMAATWSVANARYYLSVDGTTPESEAALMTQTEMWMPETK